MCCNCVDVDCGLWIVDCGGSDQESGPFLSTAFFVGLSVSSEIRGPVLVRK